DPNLDVECGNAVVVCERVAHPGHDVLHRHVVVGRAGLVHRAATLSVVRATPSSSSMYRNVLANGESLVRARTDAQSPRSRLARAHSSGGPKSGVGPVRARGLGTSAAGERG